MSDEAEVRVVTDPSEGPKAFRIQTRVTSRGEMAVILMGMDSAERVMCHESVGFDLAEGEFVFKVGPSTSGILDQLLQRGALKIQRVFDMGGGRQAPCCVLTPGGAPQPPFEGAKGRSGAAAHAAAESAMSAASESAFFDSLLAGGTSSKGQDGGDADLMMPPGLMGGGGGGGADIMAMLQQGGPGGGVGGPMGGGMGGGMGGMGGGMGGAGGGMGGGMGGMMGGGAMGGMMGGGGGMNHASMLTPPAVARHLMPRTTRGSAGGGQRIRGGGEGSADDGFFDASAGTRGRRPPQSPASMLQPDGSRGGGGGSGGIEGVSYGQTVRGGGGGGLADRSASPGGGGFPSIDGGGIFGPSSIGGMPSPFGAPPASSASSSPGPGRDPLRALLSGTGGGGAGEDGRLGLGGLGPPPGMDPRMPGASPMSSRGLSGGDSYGGVGGGGGGGVDIMGMLGKAADGAPPPPGMTSGKSLLAMLSGGGGGGDMPHMPPMSPMPGRPGGMLSAADLEARAMAGVSESSAPSPPSEDGGGVDLMGMLASASASAMPPMPAAGRFANDAVEGASGDSLGGALGLGFLGITSMDEVEFSTGYDDDNSKKYNDNNNHKKSSSSSSLGDDAIQKETKKEKEEAKKDSSNKNQKKGKKEKKNKEDAAVAAAASDKGEWPWSIGMQHRAKERAESEAGSERETAALLAAAVKEGSDRLEKTAGKKSAFEATSKLQEPLPEDNVGRQLLKKHGWEPLVDPATGGVLDEAPVPIPDMSFPERAGLGSVDRLPKGAAIGPAEDEDDVHKQARVLAMVGEAKGTLSRPSSIGKMRASSGGDGGGSGGGSIGSSRLGLSGGGGGDGSGSGNGDDDDDNDDGEWAEDKTPEAKGAAAVVAAVGGGVTAQASNDDVDGGDDESEKSKGAYDDKGTDKGADGVAGKKDDGAAGAPAATVKDSWEEMASPSPAPDMKTVGAGAAAAEKEGGDGGDADDEKSSKTSKAEAAAAAAAAKEEEEVRGGYTTGKQSEEEEEEEKGAGAKVSNAYSAEALRRLNTGCGATPPEVDLEMFQFADKDKAAAAAAKDKANKEKEQQEKAEKAKTDKAAKEAARKAEKAAKEAAKKAEKEAAKKALSNSRSNDQLDGPSLGGALGLGFLGITAVDDEPSAPEPALASKAHTDPEPEAEREAEAEAEAEPEKAPEEAAALKKSAGMSVGELAAALMAELRGLEDRVEVIGAEEGPLVALKLGAALEAIRQEPFKSI